MNADEGKNITVGDNCIFSNNIELHTTDYHSILDQNGKRTNMAKDIVIGNHVWVGLRCLILKGVILADGCVIGAGSVVTKSISSSNTLIGGAPARSFRADIYWDKNRL